MKYRGLYLIYLAILVGCTSQQPVEFSMPTDYQTQTFEFTHGNGIDLEYVEILDDPNPVDTMEQWRVWREEVEAADKLKMMNSVYSKEDNPFYVLEEQRIEKYCYDEGFEACMNIDRTCNDDGCYSVIVECDDDFYSPATDEYEECRRFDVEVSDDIDDELTDEVEAEECKH